MNIVEVTRAKFGKYPLIKKLLSPLNQLVYMFQFKRKSTVLKEEGESAFRIINDIFMKEGLRCWVEFGTLLGVYRDHYFIKNDFDFDFGAFVEDADKIREAMRMNGVKLLHEFIVEDHPEIKEMTFSINGVPFDIFFFSKSEDFYSCYIFITKDYDAKKKQILYRVKKYDFPKFELEKQKFLDGVIYVPIKTIPHLEYSYGKNFMTPDPHFKTIHNVYMDNITAICKDYN